MKFEVRAARADDIPLILPWTTDTFSWGDYVPDRLSGWLADDHSQVVVCVIEDVPVAVSHAVMLSGTEAWLEAARVHPDHKRSGMGTAMNQAGVEWAAGRGAQVVRLATEAENDPAVHQVRALGYRHTSTWVHANIVTGSVRSPAGTKPLSPSSLQDVDAAWMSWSNSDLSQAGRALLANGWQWRRARPEDLSQAAGKGEMFQSANGWVVVDRPEEDWFRVIWMATDATSAPAFLDELVALAESSGVDEVSVKMPALGWAEEALVRTGAEPKEIYLFSLSV